MRLKSWVAFKIDALLELFSVELNFMKCQAYSQAPRQSLKEEKKIDITGVKKGNKIELIEGSLTS